MGWLFLLLLGSPVEAAPWRVAVLELRDQAGLGRPAAAYLTDQVRVAALRLPGARYFVLSRENLLAQLPPGTDLAACEGDCEVETGRNVGADWVVSGEIVRLGKELRVSLKLHETASTRLVGVETAAARSEAALEVPLSAAARRLFAPLDEARTGDRPASVRVPEPEVPPPDPCDAAQCMAGAKGQEAHQACLRAAASCRGLDICDVQQCRSLANSGEARWACEVEAMACAADRQRTAPPPAQMCEEVLTRCLAAAGIDDREHRACLAAAEGCPTRPHEDAEAARIEANEPEQPVLWFSWLVQNDRMRDFFLLQGVMWLADPAARIRIGLGVSLFNLHLFDEVPAGFQTLGLSFGGQLLTRLRVTGMLGLVAAAGVHGGFVLCDDGGAERPRSAANQGRHEQCQRVAPTEAERQPSLGFGRSTTRFALEASWSHFGVQAGWSVVVPFPNGDDEAQLDPGTRHGPTLGVEYRF